VTTDTELAWAAGFYEGEGTFVIHDSGRSFNYHLRVTQKQRWPLERLQEMFGGAIYPRRTESAYGWALQGVPARDLALRFAPYLSPRRRRQIAIALLRRMQWEIPRLARRYRCPKGHLLIGANLQYYYYPGRGSTRRCRTCSRAYQTAHRLPRSVKPRT
jgi:hypothetical protein